MQPTTPQQSVYDDPRLQSARSNYEGAQRSATQMEQGATSLPDMLREALTKKFSSNNPLVSQRESALKDYLNETTAGQLSITPESAGGTAPVIFNPLQQADIIQKRRSAKLAPLSTANYLLGQETGGIEDIIGSAGRAFEGNVRASQGRAQLARSSYQDILGELSAKAEEAFKERQFQENVRQFNVSQANKGSDTKEGRATAALQTIAQEVRKGATLDQMMRRFSSNAEISPDDILRVYNTNAKTPAKESGEYLAQKYGVTPTATQGMTKSQLGKRKEAGEDISKGVAAIQQARDALKVSKSGLQYSGYSLRGRLPSFLGGINKKAKETNSKLAEVNTLLLKIAGTQFPKNEQALLGGIVTGLDKSTEENENALNTAQQRLNNQFATLKGLDATDLNILRRQGYHEDDIYEYLKTK